MAASFDWHRGCITRRTPITASYRNTQNVRRFFKSQCGDHFTFDRAFMAWLRNGKPKTMGDAVDLWLKRETGTTIWSQSRVQGEKARGRKYRRVAQRPTAS